jgi:hypothetical protein
LQRGREFADRCGGCDIHRRPLRREPTPKYGEIGPGRAGAGSWPRVHNVLAECSRTRGSEGSPLTSFHLRPSCKRARAHHERSRCTTRRTPGGAIG